jgi:hypothetical protein
MPMVSRSSNLSLLSRCGRRIQEAIIGRRLAGLLAISLLTAAAPARFIVTYDGGGNLNAYRQNFNLFRGRDIEVMIDGPCYSACTIYVALNKVCITQQAVLYFHKGPSRNSTEFMQMHWGPKLRALLATRGELPGFKSGNYLPLTYEDLKSILPTS